MNPFAYSPAGGKPSVLGRLFARPAPIVFGFCLLLGLAAVAWRAKARADTARASARTEALARSAALELQFNQAVAAAEVLGALARQSSGAIADFQKVAVALLAAHPGLASLELQPGGVVSDIAPRAGHERAIGHNVLTDPAHRPGAHAAMQSRLLTVSGPLTLDQGMPGIVVRVPVFPRGRDGREFFWGFVAVSMRLPEALSRARVDELFNRGYNYAFFAPASAQQKAIGIAASGKGAALQDTVQQPVRAQNVEFRLALQPRAGWINKTKVLLESLGVLLVSGLLGLLVNLLENRQALETALADSNQRLGRETADRKQAQENCLGAKEQAQQTIVQMQARLDAMARTETEAAAATQAQLQQALATIADLQVQREADTRAAREAAETNAARLSGAEESNGQQKSPKAPKRKRTRGDNQMDLFGNHSPPREAPDKLPADPLTKEPAREDHHLQVIEPELHPQASARAEAAEPAGAAVEHKPGQVSHPEQPAPALQADEESVTVVAGDQIAAAAASPGLASIAERPPTDDLKPVLKPEKDKPAPARRLPAPPPVNPAQLRKAVNLIVPLLADQDPGAKDCLKANRASFRSAFTTEGWLEFEPLIKGGDFSAALDQLKKAVKKHGISL